MLFILSLFFHYSYAVSCPLKDGDMVFHESQSGQSQMVKLVTGSKWGHVGAVFNDVTNKKKKQNNWIVIEAVEPIKKTPLDEFIKRGKDEVAVFKRYMGEFDAKQLKADMEKNLGIHYDGLFEWSNDRLYCSEIIFKAYENQKITIGSLQKLKELNINNPLILREAERRFSAQNRKFELKTWEQETVITPVSMFNSGNVTEVLFYSNMEQKALAPCF